MNVRVRSVGYVKMLLGDSELIITVPQNTTVAGLLAHLGQEKGEKFAPFSVEPTKASAHAPLRVLVNGRDIAALEGVQTVLHEDDDVLMFLPIAGG